MLGWVLTFVVITVATGVCGLSGVGGPLASVFKAISVVFLVPVADVLLLVTLRAFGRVMRDRTPVNLSSAERSSTLKSPGKRGSPNRGYAARAQQSKCDRKTTLMHGVCGTLYILPCGPRERPHGRFRRRPRVCGVRSADQPPPPTRARARARTHCNPCRTPS